MVTSSGCGGTKQVGPATAPRPSISAAMPWSLPRLAVSGLLLSLSGLASASFDVCNSSSAEMLVATQVGDGEDAETQDCLKIPAGRCSKVFDVVPEGERFYYFAAIPALLREFSAFADVNTSGCVVLWRDTFKARVRDCPNYPSPFSDTTAKMNLATYTACRHERMNLTADDACHRPPLWSHSRIAVMEPGADRGNGASG